MTGNFEISTKNDKKPHTQKANERVFCGASQPVLHHVCLFVPNVEASVKFYTAGIGLKVREEFDDIIGLRASRNFAFNVPSVFLQAGDGRFVELHPAQVMVKCFLLDFH